MNTVESTVYLVGCAVKNTIPSPEKIKTMNLKEVYAFASKHMMLSTVALALKSAGYIDDKTEMAIYAAINRGIQFSCALNEVVGELERSGVWYAPLKGIIIKDLYPNSYMREMADHDILIDEFQREKVKEIMERKGYIAQFYDVHNEDVYIKKPFLNFEMHTDLFKSYENRRIYEYYHGIKTKLIKDEYTHFGYHLTDDDFYLYMISHEYMHYTGGGTGLRSVMDTYVYLKNKSLHLSYIEKEAKKLGIDRFEKANRELALHLFDDGVLSEEENAMLQYMIGSGAFGTTDNMIRNSVKNQGNGIKGKLTYIISRITIPVMRSNPQYKVFERKYPYFYKHKILLPVLPVYRLYKARRKTPGRIKNEIKTINNT